MLETQLFESYVPKNSKYLLLGGFSAKKKATDTSYDWFYAKKVNQSWPILERVYSLKLETLEKKKVLLTKLHIAIGDTIYQCERKLGNSSDTNLHKFKYNLKGIEKILKENPIKKIIFTSKFSEGIYMKNFKKLVISYPNIEFDTLPSPSPRYARMSKDEKVIMYKILLPNLVL